jgi:formylmethanofuran dehydrogenase subunit E
MEKLNNVIERYLHEWLECSKCNEMVTVNSIRATNEDEPICVICNEEESTH